jgi:hypothetical protein
VPLGLGGADPNARKYQQQLDVEGGIDTQARANQAESRNRFTDILGEGQGALEQSVSSAMSAAMPEFRKAMEGVQESEVARGVGIGGGGPGNKVGGNLGTSYEGDLMSAFNRNIANAAGQQALGLYGTRAGAASSLYGLDTESAMFGRNRYMSMLGGAAANARRRSAGLFGTLGAVGGMVLGGGPGSPGGAVGADIGGQFGSALGSF